VARVCANGLAAKGELQNPRGQSEMRGAKCQLFLFWRGASVFPQRHQERLRCRHGRHLTSVRLILPSLKKGELTHHFPQSSRAARAVLRYTVNSKLRRQESPSGRPLNLQAPLRFRRCDGRSRLSSGSRRGALSLTIGISIFQAMAKRHGSANPTFRSPSRTLW
jgi:hypothetical protein